MAPRRSEVGLDTSVLLMDGVLNDVGNGRWRIPRFQRPFVWTPDRMLELFDSIERGYPIGSLLLWQTETDLATVDHIGNIRVPTEPRNGLVSYVLDGHQRLSTLFGVLRRPRGQSDDWKWQIYRNLERSVVEESSSALYQHYRRAGPAPAHLLPLSSVSRTSDFLAFARRVETSLAPDRAASILEEAEAVVQAIKNCQLAVVRLVGADLNQAVEVYTRLNRQGVRMDADQMVSALTYRDSSVPSLAARIDDIIASVAETGFGVLPRPAVFRAVLAISGERDIMTPRWEALAERLQLQLSEAVPATERAVQATVAFLRRIGLPLAKLLPYAHHLTLLAAFWNECPKPSGQQEEMLRRWFWVTSWTDAFAGANSTTMRDGLATMHRIAIGDGQLRLRFDDVVPKPERFNFNSARTRAYVAWELREFPKRLDEAGFEFDPVELLASADAQLYRWVVDRDGRPANKVIMPSIAGRHPWDQIADPSTPNPAAFLASHGITRTARDRLREGDGEGFVSERTAELDRRLAAFLDGLGVASRPDRLGDSQDDTE